MTKEELLAKIKALDLRDPSQIHVAICALQVALQTEDYSNETRNDLIVQKINYWLDLWEIEKKEEYLLSASTCIDEVKNESLTDKELKNSINRIFRICVDLFRNSEYTHLLELGIKNGFYLLDLETEDLFSETSLLQNLAVLLFYRFKTKRDVRDLTKSIDFSSETLKFDNENSHVLNNLAGAYLERYKVTGEIQDLLKAEKYFEKAFNLEPDISFLYHNYAFVLEEFFKLSGDVKHLEKRIRYLNIAFELDPENADILNDLANAYSDRFDCFGEEEDLKRRFKYIEKARKLDPENVMYISNFANAFQKQYEIKGDELDLEKIITLRFEAYENNPNHPDYLLNLASALLNRYELRQSDEDINRAFELSKRALELEPDNPHPMFVLGMAFRARFIGSRTEEDLDRAFDLIEKVFRLNPDDPNRINGLAAVILDRYRLYRLEEDLDSGIDLLEKTIQIMPNNPLYLRNLAVALNLRYNLHGREVDLQREIELLEEALQIWPNYLLCINYLVFALDNRYNLYQIEEDLDRQIELLERAFQLLPNNVTLLNHLLQVLDYRYDLHQRERDMNRQVELCEEALLLSPSSTACMNNLAVALGDRYVSYQRHEDLFRAVELQKAAFKRKPEDPTIMFHLGKLLINLFEFNLNWDDYLKGLNLIHDSLKMLPKSHPAKAERLKFLGDLYTSEAKYNDALLAYEEMATIYEDLRDVEQRRQGRRRIDEKKANAFASLASCCLLTNQPEKALRYIESAKSRVLVDTLHNQVTDLSKLDTGDPLIKDILLQLQKIQSERNNLLIELESDESDENRFCRPVEEVNAELEQKRKKEDRLWSQLESKAPVFAMTISAPPFTLKDAQELAKQENATLISYYQSAEGWLAFVIGQESFIWEPMANFDKEIDLLLERYQKAFTRVGGLMGKILMTQVLKGAWDLLLKPISAYLPERGSNLIIAPFGGLHLLPFVAFKDRETGDCLIDRYQVKVVTSLNTLKAMRAQANLPVENQTDKAMTVVAYPGADNPNEYGYLRGVETEAEEILNLFHEQTVALTKNDATTEKALKNAAGSEKLHFACHGMFNPKDPYRSGLRLKDTWLTVRDITTRMNLSGTDLVVMSSCLSGLSGLSEGEELTGLLTAFIASRARAVVGSLWPVNDKSTAKFMTEFYKNLRDGKSKVEALRDAQLHIREQSQWSHPYYWAPFFITGVE